MTTSSGRTEGTSREVPLLDPVTVLLIDDDERWARATGRLLEETRESFAVETAAGLHAGRERFADLDPDCVVCDYRLGDGTGLGMLDVVRERDPDRPFLLVTARGDEAVASDAISRGVTDYIRKGHDDQAELLASRVGAAVRTYRTERALERERRSKTDMLDILTETTAEAELRRQFCAQLVEDRGYACAWIGSRRGETTVVPEAAAGCEAYVNEVVDVDAAPEREGDEPAALALDLDEPVVVAPAGTRAATASPAEIDWRATAREHGFRAAVAAPVRHDGVRFGVLAAYAADGERIDARERDAVAEYARTVGYALRNAKRTQSLASPTPVTVAVELADPGIPLVALADRLDEAARIEVPSVLTRDDGTTLYFIRAEGSDASALEAAAGTVDAIRLSDVTPASPLRCELAVEAPTPERIAAEHGARFECTVVEDAAATVTTSVPDDGSVGTITSAFEDRYADATVSTIRTGRSEDGPTHVEGLLESLTDRQREVLQHAFRVGYFEQPRGASATDLSDHLGIARATVTQHLRTAERKILERIL